MNFAGNVAGIAVSTSVGALLALTGGSYVLPVLSAFGFGWRPVITSGRRSGRRRG
jgi:hypothetical protein